MQFDTKFREMAIAPEDTGMLARTSGGDLFAIEAKYHRRCLVNYRNAYRSAQRAKDHQDNSNDKLLQTLIFAEVVSHIENHVTNGVFILKLSEFHTLYEYHLKDTGLKKTINKCRCQEQILDTFVEDCQEQTDGKNILLVFDKGMQNILKPATANRCYDSEALLMFKLVKTASMWAQSLIEQQMVPSPKDLGWIEVQSHWKLKWSLLPEAAKACMKLIKCGCKAQPLCEKRCRCHNAGLTCTQLCYCDALCE